MTISDEWKVLRSAGEQDGLRVNLGTIFGTVVSSEPYRPVIVLGPQRSYKTAGVAIPAALEWPGAALVTSVRRDILDDTFDFRRSVGRVSIFDPARTLRGTRFEPFCASWNILEKCRSWDGSVRTSRALTESGRLGSSDLREGDFWHSLAAQLLSPHLFAAASNGCGMKDVIRWIRTQEEFEVRSLLQGTGNELAMMAIESAWQRDDRVRSSVYTTLESALRAFDYEDTGIGEAPFIDLQGFLAAPSDTIYICAPPDEQEEYRPLFTGLVRTVIREAYLRNNAAADLRDSRVRPTEATGSACNLMLLLDEAGNIA
ncbi:type IV secretory system conjugative DNA transfer family protein, partial [Staphylococcus capitis]|uniref:type IV secretory system conjugative DNA transfer family protein n=1 Tax=Staphylococcus capitis TaxID=29388 RepID=UPI003CFC89FD